MSEKKPTRPRVQKRTVVPKANSDSALDAGQIARRAYEIFLQQGAVHGRDLEHWLAAEQELRGS